jgi:hypothetical protein
MNPTAENLTYVQRAMGIVRAATLLRRQFIAGLFIFGSLTTQGLTYFNPSG